MEGLLLKLRITNSGAYEFCGCRCSGKHLYGLQLLQHLLRSVSTCVVYMFLRVPLKNSPVYEAQVDSEAYESCGADGSGNMILASEVTLPWLQE